MVDVHGGGLRFQTAWKAAPPPPFPAPTRGEPPRRGPRPPPPPRGDNTDPPARSPRRPPVTSRRSSRSERAGPAGAKAREELPVGRGWWTLKSGATARGRPGALITGDPALKNAAPHGGTPSGRNSRPRPRSSPAPLPAPLPAPPQTRPKPRKSVSDLGRPAPEADVESRFVLRTKAAGRKGPGLGALQWPGTGSGGPGTQAAQRRPPQLTGRRRPSRRRSEAGAAHALRPAALPSSRSSRKARWPGGGRGGSLSPQLNGTFSSGQVGFRPGPEWHWSGPREFLFPEHRRRACLTQQQPPAPPESPPPTAGGWVGWLVGGVPSTRDASCVTRPPTLVVTSQLIQVR